MAQAAAQELEEFEIPDGGIAGFHMTADEIAALEREEAEEEFGTGGIAEFSEVASRIASYGRYGDDTVAHVETGELIVPKALLDQNPALKESIFDHLRELGVEDPERYVVGSGINSINPETGMPEFFLKKIARAVRKTVKKVGKAVSKVAKGVEKAIKGVGKVLKKVAPVVLPIVLAMTPLGPIYGAAMGSGIATLINGGSLKDAVKSAAVSGVTAGVMTGVSGAISGDGFMNSISEAASNPIARFQQTGQGIAETATTGDFSQTFKSYTPAEELAQTTEAANPAEFQEATVEQVSYDPAGETQSLNPAQRAANRIESGQLGDNFQVSMDDAGNYSVFDTNSGQTMNVNMQDGTVNFSTPEGANYSYSDVQTQINQANTYQGPDFMDPGYQGPSVEPTFDFETGDMVYPEGYNPNAGASFEVPSDASLDQIQNLQRGPIGEGLAETYYDPSTGQIVGQDRGVMGTTQDYLFRGGRSPEQVALDQQRAMTANIDAQRQAFDAANVGSNAQFSPDMAKATAAGEKAAPGILQTYGPTAGIVTGIAVNQGLFDSEDPEPPTVEDVQDQLGPTGADLIEEDPNKYIVGDTTQNLNLLADGGQYMQGTQYGTLNRQALYSQNPFLNAFFGPQPQRRMEAGGEVYPRRNGGIMPYEGVPNEDSVRALLMPGEFVMTTDAVRGMGNGSLNQGINNMYSMMRNLESRGRRMA